MSYTYAWNKHYKFKTPKELGVLVKQYKDWRKNKSDVLSPS